VPTLAHALGLLYVLEGATLGGQLLRRRLGPALGLTEERGLAFFTAYGAEVGPMWRAFADALARFDAATPAGERPAAHAAALDAARAAFVAFERDVVAPTAGGAPPRPSDLAHA
jgi:heme oxygenase